MPKKTKSIKKKVLNAFCSCTLLLSVGYILFAGFNLIALGLIATALAGAATPTVISGDGVLEVLLGVVEAIFEGIAIVIEGISVAVSALFDW